MLFRWINERYSGSEVLGLVFEVEAAEADRCALGCDISIRAGAERGRSMSSRIGADGFVLRRAGGGVSGRATCDSHWRTREPDEAGGDCNRRYFFDGARCASNSRNARSRLDAGLWLSTDVAGDGNGAGASRGCLFADDRTVSESVLS